LQIANFFTVFPLIVAERLWPNEHLRVSLASCLLVTRQLGRPFEQGRKLDNLIEPNWMEQMNSAK